MQAQGSLHKQKGSLRIMEVGLIFAFLGVIYVGGFGLLTDKINDSFDFIIYIMNNVFNSLK